MKDVEMMRGVHTCLQYCWRRNTYAVLTKELCDAVRARVAELEEVEDLADARREARVEMSIPIVAPEAPKPTEMGAETKLTLTDQLLMMGDRVSRLMDRVDRFDRDLGGRIAAMYNRLTKQERLRACAMASENASRLDLIAKQIADLQAYFQALEAKLDRHEHSLADTTGPPIS